MKLIVTSLRLARESRGNVNGLVKIAENEIAMTNGVVSSQSGATAAAAINYCERNGLSYTVEAVYHGRQHTYVVSRMDRRRG